LSRVWINIARRAEIICHGFVRITLHVRRMPDVILIEETYNRVVIRVNLVRTGIAVEGSALSG
jgi:hypothetical protein